MKRNWKLIVGIVLVIGGFGLIPADIIAGAIDFLVGAVLIAWWVLGRKRATKKDPKAITQSTSQTLESTTQPQSASDKYDVLVPEKKDGAPIAYRYSVPFTPTDPDTVLSIAKAEQWYLTARKIGQDVHLFSGEIDLGILTERSDMVSDWIRRGEPYLIILERVNSETGCKVMLIFYRDKQKHYAYKEQTLVSLTGYKAESKQNVISCLSSGDELEAEEDFEKEGRVTVSYCGDTIGSFPKKYADRFIEEGAAFIVFDHGEESEDGLVTKPVIKVYW